MKKDFNRIAVIFFMLIALSNTYAQERAPCYAMVNGQLMHLVTGSLVSCARTIQATRQGHGQIAKGRWGSHEVAVDQNSSVYVDGEAVGRAKNPSGTYGSLSDRCQSGDAAACEQWRRQTENAQRQYESMFHR